MVEQPSGRVTLVFTDIEGSTRLLEELGQDAYREALARHRDIVRAAFAAYGGYEVDYEGDAFFYAFASAEDALAAVEQATAGLEDGPIRIRVGVHTGEPGLDPPKYVGIDVHRAARIMAAGHGGQVVVSEAARLASGRELRPLGAHRLKDLTAPEPLWQLGGGEYPPLKSLNQSNLPVQPTPFLGRERDIEEVLGLLRREEVRLLTLTGPGGTGKTRLALQAATELVDESPHGVWFVNLAALTDAALVVPTIAQTLGVKEEPGRPLAQSLGDRLASQQTLLVLDNFEQVIEAASSIAAVLAATTETKLLVTSRVALRVSAEHEYPVSTLSDEEALALFVQRAQAVKPTFALNGERALVVAICQRLDRLPLAIELAAARAKLLPPQALLDRLGERMKLLTGGARDLPVRQQTLRATIEWSHSLLTEAERALFARLSIFAGGWTLEAAEAICNADGSIEVFDGLASLVDNSLVRQEGSAVDAARFLMLETIHEYARERLAESEDTEDIARRHAEYFATFAEELSPELERAQHVALARADADYENIRAALAWAQATGDSTFSLRLAGALQNYWLVRGNLSEGRRWLDHALARGDDQPAEMRANALGGASTIASLQGDTEATSRYASEASELCRKVGDVPRLVFALNDLANIAAMEGNRERAVALAEESLAAARAADDRWLLGISAANYGNVALVLGDYDRAAALSRESAALFDELDDSWGRTISLLNLAAVGVCADRCEEALPAATEALTLSVAVGHPAGLGGGVETLAWLAAKQQEFERAATLFGAAAQVFERIGFRLVGREQKIHELLVEAVQNHLGTETFAARWAIGKEMSDEDAVRYALGS